MEKKILIVGGNKLNGKLKVQTSKNATLPIIAGSILTESETVLNNIPNLLDIENMIKIIQDLGVQTRYKDNQLTINPKNIDKFVIDAGLAKNLRSSIFMLGPMLARFKKVTISYPGGCDIGNRPIDLHLSGLKELGCNITKRHSLIICDGSNMKSGTIHLDFASVGATENLIMASVFLKGKTKIINSAKEPEIVDLQNFLNQMGCKISGAGTSEIEIIGVDKLNGTNYTPIGDRIVAGTYLIASAMCGGNIELENINPEHLQALTTKLIQAGCQIQEKKDSIILSSNGKLNSIPIIDTQVYPAFPTDLQAQIMSMQTISQGTSVIVENIFENRFRHAKEFVKMGADIYIKDRVAVIKGVEKLNGAPVDATDLRGGASLILAGLVANGYTTINNIYHIERGYDDIVSALKSLGADIKYIEE